MHLNCLPGRETFRGNNLLDVPFMYPDFAGEMACLPIRKRDPGERVAHFFSISTEKFIQSLVYSNRFPGREA
jgi:hypothetical protein